jgi:hypothetical protein
MTGAAAEARPVRLNVIPIAPLLNGEHDSISWPNLTNQCAPRTVSALATGTEQSEKRYRRTALDIALENLVSRQFGRSVRGL